MIQGLGAPELWSASSPRTLARLLRRAVRLQRAQGGSALPLASAHGIV
jgi:hypothetical protein